MLFDEVAGENRSTPPPSFYAARTSQAARQDSRGIYLRLVKEADAESKRRRRSRAALAKAARLKSGKSAPSVYEYRQGDFAMPFPAARGSIGRITPVASSTVYRRVASAMKSMWPNTKMRNDALGDNYRFLRFWWELGAHRTSGSRAAQVDLLQAALATLIKGMVSLHERWSISAVGTAIRRM